MKKKTKLISNTTPSIFLFILILLSSLSISIAVSQPQQEWVARYNSPENYSDTIADMELDEMGNIYILGYNSNNFFTLKYNNNGVLKWVRKYRGPSIYQGRPSDMVIDDSGNVYITGYTYTGNQSPYKKELVIIKYSSVGDTLWSKRFINSDSLGCTGNNVLLADSGYIYITSVCRRVGTGYDVTALKYLTSGDLVWEKYYSDPLYNTIYSSVTDKNHNLYVIGSMGNNKVKIIRYLVNGLLNLEIRDTITGYKIFVDDDYNIHTSGHTYTSTTREDIGTNKYDSSGNKLWFSYYHHNSFMNHDTYRDFTIDRSGNSYVTGTSADGMELAWDIVTIKYNQNGDSLWVQRYDSIYNSSDCPSSIAVDNTGNVYVAGYTNFFLLWNSYITICYDSTGNQKFVLFYNNGLPFYGHEAKYIKTDSAGNIYVSGVSQNSNGNYDIATIKYSILSSLNPISSIVPKESKLHQNFPNPFNSNTKIRFEISRAGIVELEIYDILGRKLQTLFKGYETPGVYEKNFDSLNLPGGVYFYRLSINGKIADTKRMNLIK